MRRPLRKGWLPGCTPLVQCWERPPAPLDRANSYIAVMIDDLTLHGVSEPYRMLTARAEYRLRLRANNASTRLTPLALAAGCVGLERAEWFARREEARTRHEAALDRWARPAELGLAAGSGEARALRDWLRLPAVTLAMVLGEATPSDPALAEEIAEGAAYAPYLARQDAEIRDLRAGEALPLPGTLDYSAIPGLSNEMTERLAAARPATLGAAGRIAGITPAALAVLLVHARQYATA